VASGTESDTAPASSSSNAATQTIVKNVVPMMYEYWKKSMVIEVDLAAYHTVDWLPGGVISSTLDLELPTIDKTVIVCFESHLITGLGLAPSKFLVSILNFLRCELVHLNLNAVAALNYFSMMREYWLRIAPDTRLFYYLTFQDDMHALLICGSPVLESECHLCVAEDSKWSDEHYFFFVVTSDVDLIIA
jgi:hypothetical protein